MREPLFGSLQSTRQLGVPLRHRKAQPAHKERQARDRAAARKCEPPHRPAHRSAHGARLASVGAGLVLVCGVDADAVLTPRHTQQAAVVHGVQQMGRGVRRAAPVVLHRAVREMFIYLARVHCTAFAYELQQELCLLPACSRPGRPTSSAGTRESERGCISACKELVTKP